jgi:hypothetical protein
MPAKSKAQRHLIAAAEHGATFPMAKKVRASMTHAQMHDFAAGSEKGKPAHVSKGTSRDTESYVYGHNRRGKKS